MRPLEPSSWDDFILAVLLLITGLPRALLALVSERPIEAEGAVSLACVVFGLMILVRRNTWARAPKAR